MKKIYISAVAVGAIAVFGMTTAFAAANSTLIAENEKTKVSFSYQPSSNVASTYDSKKLFGNFEKLSTDQEQKTDISITSINKNNLPVEVSLRLVSEKEDAAETLNSYSFKITSADGTVSYNDDSVAQNGENGVYRDINIGMFNEQFSKETKKFTVEYKLKNELSGGIVPNDIDVLLVATPVEPEYSDIAYTPVSNETVETTVEPTAELEVSAETPAATAVVAAEVKTEVPSPTAEAVAAVVSDEGLSTKVCGKGKDQIAPGRYIVTGNGKVRVKSKNGDIKSETVVRDKSKTDVNGVEQFIVTLTEGDVVEVRPLDGEKKPHVEFKTAQSTQVSAASKNDKSANTSDKNAANNKNTEKSNPKTGDNGVALGVLGGLMGMAIVAFGGIEVLKKKKNINK